MYAIYLPDEEDESKATFVISKHLLLNQNPPFNLVPENFDFAKFNDLVIKKVKEWPNFDPAAEHLKNLNENCSTGPNLDQSVSNQETASNQDAEVKKEVTSEDEKNGNEAGDDDEDDVIIFYEKPAGNQSDVEKSRDQRRKSIAVSELSTEQN